jgi:Tfp pilus assembly protein PilF
MDQILSTKSEVQDSPEVVQAKKLHDAGMQLARGGKGAVALTMLRRAARLAPNRGRILTDLGSLLYHEGQYAEAHDWLVRAVNSDLENTEYMDNLAIYDGAMGMQKSAELAFHYALRLKPDDPKLLWDLSLFLLRQGDWAQGLSYYESRKDCFGPEQFPRMPIPTWTGQSLHDKTLYIQAEQGLGDRILFSRYIAWIRKIYPTAKIKFCCGDQLTNLFWSFTDHNIELLPNNIPWMDGLDYGIYLNSLPMLHETTDYRILEDPGWIRARIDKDKTGVRLPQPDLPSLKVGICFTGSPSMNRNSDRSIPLKEIMRLAEDPRIQLYNFQCGSGHKEFLDSCADSLIVDLAPAIEKEGLVGTALALKQMDVIITCCTSIAHLSGALGLNCWTLLCADPYWIWQREGCKTSWYPQMRLFRQKQMGDWSTVLDEVKTALSELADQTLDNNQQLMA